MTESVENLIEKFHAEIRRQFSEMYMSQRPTLAQLQAQQTAECIEQIKNILFARLLMRLIKNHSMTGNQEPLIIDLINLVEVI